SGTASAGTAGGAHFPLISFGRVARAGRPIEVGIGGRYVVGRQLRGRQAARWSADLELDLGQCAVTGACGRAVRVLVSGAANVHATVGTRGRERGPSGRAAGACGVLINGHHDVAAAVPNE